MDIWERMRFARDRALEAEETERQRLADADTKDLQQAASVRLATRQSVREALDDVLDEHSEPAKGRSSAGSSGQEDLSGQDQPPSTPTVTEPAESVEEDPGAQISG